MSTHEEQSALVEALKTISHYKTVELVSRNKWGDLNFEDIKSSIDLIVQLADELINLPIQYIPSTDVGNMSSQCENIRTKLEEIDNYSVREHDLSYRDTIAQQLERYVDDFVRQYGIWYSFVKLRSQDVQEELKKIKEITSEVNQYKGDVNAVLIDTTEQSEKILDETRKAAAEVGVATFTTQFNDESLDLTERSKKWFFGTVCSALATVTVSILLYFFGSGELTSTVTLKSISLIVAKISIVGVLAATTFWCGRIYKSLVHLATVNRHRALSLQTFQAFSAATKDSNTRDAVLKAATSCIFANVPTGFVDARGRSGDAAVQSMEIGNLMHSDG